MISLIIVSLLCFQGYIGIKRGVILQAYYSVAYMLILVIASRYYQNLSQPLSLWLPYPSATLSSYFAFFSTTVGLKLDQAFYYGCAFLAITLIGWIFVRFIGMFLTGLRHYPQYDVLREGGGLILGCLTAYVALTMILYLAALIPIDSWQTALSQSFLPRLMIRYTPILSNWLTQLWVIG